MSETTKKRGRPKEPNARDKRVDIRLTAAELQKVDDVAEKLKTSRTGAIMKGIERIKADLDA